MAELAERIAAVCREMESDDLREILSEAGREDVLDRILAAIAAGADEAIRDELDALDAILIEHGIAGGLLPPSQRDIRPAPPPTGYQPTPTGGDQLHPAIEVWGCPNGRCARWVGAASGDDAYCAVQKAPLVKKRLGG